MAAVTAQDVKKLREITGVGMMDCKKALIEAEGDFEKAIEILRKKGQKVAAKRADREANEGMALAVTTDDHGRGVVVLINSETDFVAKNEDFQNAVKAIAAAALSAFPADKAALENVEVEGGQTVGKLLEELTARIGEKIVLGGYDRLEADTVVAYNHLNNKIGVLVGLNVPPSEAAFTVGRDVAMQVAAMRPLSVDKDDVPADILEKELEIAREQVRQMGKPEHLVDRIAQGKLNKFFKENTLLNQEFVKDNSKTVRDYVKEALGKEATVTGFVRLGIA